MKPFLTLQSVDGILEYINDFPALAAESVPLDAAAGRRIAEAWRAPADLPGFDRSTVDGYAGPIRQWTGVDSNGHVTGLVVRDMEETFGLGRNALTDIDFLVQFVGTSGEAEVGGGVDAITGATVTSRAVARGVSSACAYVTGADVSTSATEWGG